MKEIRRTRFPGGFKFDGQVSISKYNRRSGKIHRHLKANWLKFPPAEQHVVYYLFDKHEQLIYIGEPTACIRASDASHTQVLSGWR